MQTLATADRSRRAEEGQKTPARVKNILAKAAATAAEITKKHERTILAVMAVGAAVLVIAQAFDNDTWTLIGAGTAMAAMLPQALAPFAQKGGES